jgi:hypothetical protein
MNKVKAQQRCPMMAGKKRKRMAVMRCEQHSISLEHSEEKKFVQELWAH